MVAHHFGVVGVVGSNPAVPIKSRFYISESFNKDWINFVVLIRTAKNTKRVKNIINPKRYGGISISPKETMNKLVRNFIKTE